MALVQYARQGLYARRLYWDLIGDPNLVSLQVCNETSGTTIYDRCTKNLINGTTIGSPSLGVSLGNGFYGVTLNPAQSQNINLETPTILAFERTSPFTIVMLIKSVIIAVGTYALVCKTATGIQIGPGWSLSTVVGQLHLHLINTLGTNELRVRGGTTLSNATFYLLAVTYDGSSTPAGVQFYVNAVAEAKTTLVDNLSASILTTAKVNIGSTNGEGSFIDSTVGPTAIFNAVKTARDFRRWTYLAGLL